jgi:hypothetical protein
MTFWKSWGAHALAYVLSILAIVAHTDPTLLGSHGLMIAGVAGLLITFIHNAQTLAKKGSAASAGRQSGRASVPLLLVVATAGAALLIGCSTFTKTMSNPASAAAVQAAVDVGVGTFIQQTAKTPAAQANEAQQITVIATALEGVLTGNQATLAQLDQMLQARVAASNLPPADKAAALILAQTIQSIVMQQIQAGAAAGGSGPLAANQVVAIKTVLDDVLQAASFYNVHAMAAMRADMAQ